MLRTTTAMLSLVMVTACYQVPPQQNYVYDPVGDAVGLTVMSQILLAGGVPGLALFPLLVAADVHATNQAMVQANTRATLDQTYQYAYNRPLDTVSASGNTGVLFRDMPSATAYFRNVLRGHGVADVDSYLLTAVRTADTQGYTLYALVHRPQRSITVRTADGRIRTLTAQDQEFWRPYRLDAQGRTLDMVIDWAGVQRTLISNQKGQAILLTLAANSVLMNRRSDEYWSIENRWLNGDYQSVVAERKREIDRRTGEL